jgi:ribosomal protein S18 acetylase RimI-like enzyme
VIRRATPADIDALVGLQSRSWRHAYGDFVDPDLMPSAAQRAARWREVLGGEAMAFLWDQEGDVAGFVVCGPDRGDEPQIGEIYAIAVEPAAQGAGLGSRLLAHAVQELTRAGFARALLWCLEANGLARAFYERHGWAQDDGRRDHPWGPEVRYRRAL